MDKGDVEMRDVETNVPASDVLGSNESLVKYENGVKTGKSNAEDKTHDQCDSKGEDSKNARSETEDELNFKSQPEAHNNVVLENKTPTVDAGMDDMVNGYVKLTDDEVQIIDEGEVNDVHQSEKIINEVNQNGNNMLVDRSEDPQMKTNATTVTTDGDARSDEFPKVTIEVMDSSIGKAPEPASLMFLINPSTANDGQHSGEASENISGMMVDGEDDEGSPEDQAAFIGKLGTFYQEKAMEFKLPKFYGHPLNCLKLWRSVIRLGGYDRVTGCKLWRQVGDSFNPPKTCTTVSWTFRGFYEKLLLQYERHRTQNGELQLPIAPPPGFSGVDNEGSGYQISASGRAVRDSAARCRLGWQEQHSLGYGEVAEPIVKDRSAYNTPKHAKNLKSSGSLKNQGQNEEEHAMKAAGTETSKQLDVQVVDVGPPADWVKINVRETNDSFEVYALVPGLSREEVWVQSDPAGRLVITGQPNQFDNLWGVTAFKKMVTLPARIDQLRTNAVFTLHGCLHVHVPLAQQNL
ncbi:AT-rich interactive domain-containing protein 6-like [Solanum stenotomum]|uniref:AT-rich interactive domain-containing protein 6-like n=1 Tax=Solanum stenotomum TaxID=172797 RepID=UPI0020D1E8FF|nr:AT-rich interactive domain-containing protein 6-like [Solanum stenotomum]